MKTELAKPERVASNAVASNHWDVVLSRLDSIDALDTDALAAYVLCYAESERMAGVLMVEGDTITNPSTGVTKIHPLLGQQNLLHQRLDRLRRDLRFTPDSRGASFKTPVRSLREQLR